MLLLWLAGIGGMCSSVGTAENRKRFKYADMSQPTSSCLLLWTPWSQRLVTVSNDHKSGNYFRQRKA